MRSIFLSTIFPCAIVMSSCDNSKKATTAATDNIAPDALYKSEWKLTEIDGDKAGDDSKIVISFIEGQPGKVSGFSGCNRFSGNFELVPASPLNIKFSPMAATKMACLNEKDNKSETRFLDMFFSITRWYIKDDVLTLYSKETKMATFIRQKSASAEELKLNGEWELNYISGPRIAFDGLFPNKKPTIIFNLPQEEANGNGSCNGYSVKVKVNGNAINFDDALSTMMACEGNGEPLYFKTLKTVTSYTITGNTLTMLMGDIAVMRFTKK